jgi:hypothetical protein
MADDLNRQIRMQDREIRPEADARAGSSARFADADARAAAGKIDWTNALSPHAEKSPGACKAVLKTCKKSFSQGDETAHMKDAALSWNARMDNKAMEQECENLVCHPMCTEAAFNCTFNAEWKSRLYPGKGALVELLEEKYQRAVCRQFVGKFCTSKTTGLAGAAGAGLACCDKESAFVANWVDDAQYDTDGIRPLLPIPFCHHNRADPKEKERKCSVCKEQAQRNVRFKVKPTEWGCSQAYGGTPYEESFQQFMKPLDKTQSRSMLELCIQLAKLPEAQAGPVVSSAEATELCTCLGCCEAPRGKDACPFPVTVTDYDCPDCGK